jgi:hypothetical protein
MEKKYTYKGENITTDIIFKIENIVEILSHRNKKNFDTMYVEFLESKTYSTLKNTDSLLWTESSEFIADEYERETGTNPKQSQAKREK